MTIVRARPTRAERLKARLHSHSIPGESYRSETRGCMERARYWTESFKETEGEPIVIRRARALANYLEKKSIFIMGDDLIAGNAGRTPDHLPFYPELQSRERIEAEILSRAMFTPEEWEELDGILDYWKGKTLEEACVAEFSDEAKKHVWT